MVERFVLPNASATVQKLVDRMGRRTFDGMQDSGEGELILILVSQERTKQMNVIRHHNASMQQDSIFMLRHTVFQNNISRRRRQDPPVKGAEPNAMCRIVALDMGEISSILEL